MNRKGHFTGETILISILASVLAYFAVERLFARRLMQKERNASKAKKRQAMKTTNH
ncbi:MAG TPA: hypothetical protein VJB12_01000 [Candidatus Nanoarchaeia archaeon]|nr:hypothetical protein [Candidatus Nanoarchaeia archaeon]